MFPTYSKRDYLEKLDLLEQIHERLKKIESESKELKDTVAQIENGLNSIKKDVEEVKIATEQKADKSRVEALEKEVEDLRNRSRRNNLVFYNIPEKAEGEDCISFIQNFISTHMGLETLWSLKSSVLTEHQRSHGAILMVNKDRDRYMWPSYATRIK